MNRSHSLSIDRIWSDTYLIHEWQKSIMTNIETEKTPIRRDVLFAECIICRGKCLIPNPLAGLRVCRIIEIKR